MFIQRPLMNPSAHTVQVIMVLGYGLMCFLSFVLIAHLRHNRSDALKGNSSAAQRVILPAFEPLLWILGATTGTFTLTLFLLLVLDVFESGPSKVAAECFYCGRQFVFLLVMVSMHQKSVSIPALRRCVLISLVLATYTLPFVVYTATWGDPSKADLYYVVQRVLRLLLVAGYVYICLYPPTRASKKTIREFCAFTFVYQGLSITANELFHAGYRDSGYVVTNGALLWAGLCPLLIWRVLRADTEHWRGMGQRACALQHVLRSRNRIHEHVSSQGLHLLIEMHRKLLIDFAYLELKRKIGVGASAVVYNGLLHSRTPVATKVYTPRTLTDEVVASFSQEAALCGALHHPNIVTFRGLCVYPPTICLVFELCQGSLDSVVLSNQRLEATQVVRQTVSINVGYMHDAARAVAYLHSFSPSFIHRDIKPANFLVDSDHNVKLSDFGESRAVTSSGEATRSSSTGMVIEPDDRFTAVTSLPSPTVLQVRETAQQMTVKGTVEYMAPELINGKGGFACYGEAADVYSLAMTMWDILHPGEERYPGCTNNHLHVFQAVLDGKRPDVSPDVHPTLRELICSGWHEDPRLRPTAHEMVSILETIQEEVCAQSIVACLDDFGAESLVLLVSAEDGSGDGQTNPVPTGMFTGFDTVEHLRSNRYVANVAEALRMGRMWMDAGFLHHAKHAHGFTDNEEAFYLDEDAIRLCQPLRNGGGGTHDRFHFNGSSSGGPRPATSRPCSRSHSSSFGYRRRRGLAPTSETVPSTVSSRVPPCACRKHGQRLTHDLKSSRRHRFRRKKVPTIAEVDVLTASFLAPHEETGSYSTKTGLSDFDWVGLGDERIQE